MKIPILNALETREQWKDFSHREISYAYIDSPLTLIDFQTSYLLITTIDKNLHDGRLATKYSIGSKHSSDAAWELIKRCQWSLTKVLAGLNSLDFNTNVRDNCALNIQGDTTVRKFFSKEKAIISPNLLKPLTRLATTPKHFDVEQVSQLLCFEQYTQLEILPNPFKFNSVKAILLQLISHPSSWEVMQKKEKISLKFHNDTVLSCCVKIEPQNKLIKSCSVTDQSKKISIR
jgi:hypothetical protein